MDNNSTTVSRRAVLAAGAASGAAMLTGAAESSVAQERGATRVVDTHLHFYDPSRPQGVPWPPKDDAVLYRTVMPAEFRRLATPLGVSGAIVIEASPWPEDNQWLLDLAENERFILGVVGNVPPGEEGFGGRIGALSKNTLFRGIRIGGRVLREKLERREFIDDLKALADAGLSLDVLGDAAMFADVDRLAEMVPSLRIVLDHLPFDEPGEGSKRGEVRQALGRVAKRNNVYAKVSGVVRRSSGGRGEPITDPAFYAPLLDGLWSAFGDGRVIYGSNWPVSDRVGSYDVVLKVVSDYLKAKGPAMREKFFWKNAQAAYGWRER